ncbi:gas vesicle accessory protein GvpU [Thalassobacillus sp. CUG 92003]|uniref:gas vesicle accessory protein GvpU n=1 Tax=Thalassobacillus sp. CUG 92003 TaxID=2736641 RepID=UPI0015E6E304|nr:gas vesicle accessory protein GvpU [Thalassobacillus sp. CUG 92003]
METNDEMLTMFVEAANKHDFALDMTLNVNGSLVTGTTISAQHYFETIASDLNNGNDIAKAVGEKLSEAGNAAKDQNQGGATFVHLKNTQIYSGDAPIPSEGNFVWRGKIEEVDGFFLGKISADK